MKIRQPKKIRKKIKKSVQERTVPDRASFILIRSRSRSNQNETSPVGDSPFLYTFFYFFSYFFWLSDLHVHFLFFCNFFLHFFFAFFFAFLHASCTLFDVQQGLSWVRPVNGSCHFFTILNVFYLSYWVNLDCLTFYLYCIQNIPCLVERFTYLCVLVFFILETHENQLYLVQNDTFNTFFGLDVYLIQTTFTISIFAFIGYHIPTVPIV